MPRERLPDRRPAETLDLWHGGRRYHLTIGEYPDGRPGEVFIHGAKPGSDTDLQRLVQERARATRRPKLMDQLRGKGTWDDIGALKAWLRDDLVSERNRYAREVVKDVKARKRESEATP